MLHAAANCRATQDIQLWLKGHLLAVRGDNGILGACFICSSLAGCHHRNSCFVASLQMLQLSSLLQNPADSACASTLKPVSSLLNQIRKAGQTATGCLC